MAGPGNTIDVGESESHAERTSRRRAYRAAATVAIATSFLIVWTTVVRDDGTGIGFFLVIMAAGVGGYAARFRPAGMARAMLGVAIMQLLYTIAVATAPVTANLPGGSPKALLSGAFFAALWLISAAFFRAAAARRPGGA